MRGSSGPPSTRPILTCARCRIALLRRHFLRLLLGDTPFELWAEVANEALDRPRRSVAKTADRVAFALLADFPELVDLLDAGVAGFHAFHHAPHPAGALAAG